MGDPAWFSQLPLEMSIRVVDLPQDIKDDTDILPIGELVFMTLELLRVLSASLP